MPPFLMGMSAKLIALAVAVVFVFGGGFWTGHRIEADKLDRFKTEVADARAEADAKALALQKQYDDLASSAAQADQQKQAAIQAALSQQKKEIASHVPPIRACVPIGLLRVLRGAELGLSASGVPQPAGKSDDACSTVGWPRLAAAIITDLATARANAAQLDALTGYMRTAKASAK